LLIESGLAWQLVVGIVAQLLNAVGFFVDAQPRTEQMRAESGSAFSALAGPISMEHLAFFTRAV
jgi:hypothetical protein